MGRRWAAGVEISMPMVRLSNPAALLSWLVANTSFLGVLGKDRVFGGQRGDLLAAVRHWVPARAARGCTREGAEGGAVAIPVPAATGACGGRGGDCLPGDMEHEGPSLGSVGAARLSGAVHCSCSGMGGGVGMGGESPAPSELDWALQGLAALLGLTL